MMRMKTTPTMMKRFDGFSTDYPSVMFSVIRQLKERAKASSPNHDIWHDDVK